MVTDKQTRAEAVYNRSSFYSRFWGRADSSTVTHSDSTFFSKAITRLTLILSDIIQPLLMQPSLQNYISSK